MKVKKELYIPSLVILLVIIAAVIANLNMLQATINSIYSGLISSFGWLFVLADICCLIFSVWLMFGRYKDVRLGGPQSKPNFSTWSWAGMMFTTSCGAWLIVYGFLEPMYCVAQDAVTTGDAISKTYEYGQMYAHFHWGPNAWAIYVPITIAIGYSLYNRNGQSATVSAGISSITKNRPQKVIALIIDIIAVCSVVIAPVISVGTGMPLLTALVQNIFGISDAYKTIIQLVILLIWISIFGTSVYMGLDKGIKRLSNINVTTAFIFMAIFAILNGVIKVFSAELNTVGLLVQNFVRLNTYTDPYGDGSFVKGWTFSYWACYFVYMPLMGVFNAKISKGRTLKQIAFGQLVLCTLGCWVAMGTLGNFAINANKTGLVDVAGFLAADDEAGAVIALVNTLPLSKLFMVALLAIMFIFLATTMDSSAFAAAEMVTIQDQKGGTTPRWVRIVWSVIASIISFFVVQVGGAKAVRSVCYIAGLPLALVAFVVIYSVVKMLNEDHKRKSDWPFLFEDE